MTPKQPIFVLNGDVALGAPGIVTTKDIAAISEGDMIAYWDFERNHINERPVGSITTSTIDTVNITDVNNKTVKVARNQCFYKKDTGWVAHDPGTSDYTSTQIAVDDELLIFDGSYVKVASISERGAHLVYDFAIPVCTTANNQNIICNGFVLHS